eukprot:scaffold28986_cov58-Phaeocystis_antarctica.AAC.2
MPVSAPRRVRLNVHRAPAATSDPRATPRRVKAATKRLLVSGSVHLAVGRWRCRPRARPTHTSLGYVFKRAALSLRSRKGDAPTGASVTTLDVCRARRSRARWQLQRGLGRRPPPQHLRVLQAGLRHWPHVRLHLRARLPWTELDSSRRQCEDALTRSPATRAGHAWVISPIHQRRDVAKGLVGAQE